MKSKTWIIIIAITLFVALISCIIYYSIMLYAHSKIIDNDYESYSVISDDGQFLLVTEKIEGTVGHFATFKIKKVGGQEWVFECLDIYRTQDLKSISWDSLDVIVISGDLGTIIYKYNDDGWAVSD